MALSTTARRSAQISFGEKGDTRAVRVSVPGRPTPGDIDKINKVLINDVIKNLTGCPCMSGLVDVIWEPAFKHALEVNFEAVKPGA
ncbi:MAG TPA: hypothetical protein VF548_11150 [Allosphingosinicella sp.]